MRAIPDLYKKLLGVRGKFKEKFKVFDKVLKIFIKVVRKVCQKVIKFKKWGGGQNCIGAKMLISITF